MIGTDIAFAAALLKRGQVVAIPTETVYGLAGNALSADVVVQIFEVKNRPHFDPLIVHLPKVSSIEQYAEMLPPKAQLLADAFMPGPLTLLLPKKPIIPDIVTSGASLCAFRVPDHQMARELLSLLDFPLAAPSANPFGYISPTTAQHVARQLGEKIPYILDGGPCTVGIESTIVGFEEEFPVIYRKGGLSVEAIEEMVGKVTIREHSSSNPLAPGMLKSHYAPRTPLVIGNLYELHARFKEKRIAVLALSHGLADIEPANQFILSTSGNLGEAARNLFAGMRYLDAIDAELIIAELMPEKGLGRAVNDRLRRAAAGA